MRKQTKLFLPEANKLLGWTDSEVYGHGEIVRQYTGVHRRVLGHLQHGWNPGTGWTLGGRELISRYSVRHVWSDRQVAESRARGIRVRSVVGAPWLYGPYIYWSQIRIQGATPRFVTVQPLHGTAVHPVEYSHRELIRRISAEYSELRVCLHHNEMQDDNIVSLYRDAGWDVCSAGNPRDPAFLFNLCTIFADTAIYISNRLSTGALYAGSMGIDVRILDDIATLTVEKGEVPISLVELTRNIREAVGNSDTIVDLSLKELGSNWVLAPEELASALGMAGGARAEYPLRLGASLAGRVYRRFRSGYACSSVGRRVWVSDAGK